MNKEQEKELKMIINEFHLASLILADKNAKFEEVEKAKGIFADKVKNLLKAQRDKIRDERFSDIDFKGTREAIIKDAKQAQKESIIKMIEGIEVNENFSPLYRNGFLRAKSDIIKTLKEDEVS